MTQRELEFGDVVTVAFPQQSPQGREQEGYRPAIVVGIPEKIRCSPVQCAACCATHFQIKGMTWPDKAPLLYPKFPVGTAKIASTSAPKSRQLRHLNRANFGT